MKEYAHESPKFLEKSNSRTEHKYKIKSRLL